jgi:hypothetical protein
MFMRRKYNTIEEFREAERARQKVWREKNRGYERLRAKNRYMVKRGVGGSAGASDQDGEELRGKGSAGSEAVISGGVVCGDGVTGGARAAGDEGVMVELEM